MSSFATDAAPVVGPFSVVDELPLWRWRRAAAAVRLRDRGGGRPK